MIADNFDPDMFGVLYVTKPDGNGIYHVVEGQHRKSAVELLFGANEKVPCMVLDAIEPARAAEIFLTINGRRKNPSPVATFKVAVTAGHETEVSVDRIVRKAGYRIESHTQDKTISAVQALVAIHKQHSGKVLETTLQVIQATWGMDHNAVIAPILRGYALFLGAFGHQANLGRLKEVIAKKYTPGRLLASAKTVREAEGGTMPDTIKKMLTSNYNRGLRAGQLDENKRSPHSSSHDDSDDTHAVH
jgi:hypothetical protein